MITKINPVKPESSTALNLKSQHILILEDDPSLSEILQTILQEEGFTCSIYDHSKDIIKLMKKENPDLVLLDYLLPHVNGGDLCGQIKRDPYFSSVPVIIYSAWSKVLLSLGNYGCDMFIEKPFNLEVLLYNIHKLLNKNYS